MKIAITGASGTLGQQVVKVVANAGHSSVQIDLKKQPLGDIPNSEMRQADCASDYKGFLKALEGCDAMVHLAAIPNPENHSDDIVHANNVNSAFNGFRAAGELGINRISYASSVNAIGLSYANRPLHFDAFPLDEECPQHPTDSYALAKAEGEVQAKAFVEWFPNMKVACLRIHEVASREYVRKEHAEFWDEAGVKQLWGWVHPEATARACLLAIENSDNFSGFEIFNIHAPTTAQETPSRDLAQKYFPDARMAESWGKTNEGFWTTEKAKRILKWEHYELE